MTKQLSCLDKYDLRCVNSTKTVNFGLIYISIFLCQIKYKIKYIFGIRIVTHELKLKLLTIPYAYNQHTKKIKTISKTEN